MTNDEIIKICKKYNIKNYIINKNGFVDINNDVDLFDKELDNLPLKFGRIVGYFECSHNNLSTLHNCPLYVDTWFDCSHNNITSLEYGPNIVGGKFTCNGNILTSLEHCPKFIGDEFVCYNDINMCERQSINLLNDVFRIDCKYILWKF